MTRGKFPIGKESRADRMSSYLKSYCFMWDILDYDELYAKCAYLPCKYLAIVICIQKYLIIHSAK
jgi:hypothetical protein